MSKYQSTFKRITSFHLYCFDKINKNFAELDVTNTVKDIKGSVFADDSTLLVDAVNGVIPGYIKLDTLKSTVAASTDFADFKSRIANLT